MGIAGSTLLIDFYPTLQVRPTILPPSNPSPVFVIANTLVTADKHVTAPTNYNLRVVECRMAAALLAKFVNTAVTLEDDFKNTKSLKPTTLRNVAEEYCKGAIAAGVKYSGGDRFDECAPEVLNELMETVQKSFKEDGYSKDDLAKELDMSVSVFPKRQIWFVQKVHCINFG